MTELKLILATRRSALALAQARAFARRLEGAVRGLVVDELQIVTTGDKIQDRPLSQVGGKGLFTKEIEQALADGQAHFAVHSFKDVPAELASTFAIACVPTRVDPRDVLVSKTGQRLDELPAGAKVGTSSLRRSLQLSARRPDLVIVPMRGNVDTRLRKVDAGECDAIVLARAGMERLGLAARATETLDTTISIPAAGQGALAIECRADDAATRKVLATLHDDESGLAVACERGVMAFVGGSCTVPFAAYARREGDRLHLDALLANEDGTGLRRASRDAAWPRTEAEAAAIGKDAGEELARK